MYRITDQPEEIQLNEIAALLKQSYWADRRSEETIKSSVENSLCFGALNEQNKLIGFARVITDYATTYYLCDVIVDEKERGNGIGKALIDTLTKDERLIHLRGLLLTRDAHGLYEQYGFYKDGKMFMGRNPI